MFQKQILFSWVLDKKMRDLEETLCITVQSESIYRAPFVKYLGFFIDENLDWGYHVSHVLKKV